MTAPTAPTATVRPDAGTRPALWGPGLLAAATAAAAVAAVAALARAADVSLALDGEPIPVLGFAQVALFWSVVGVALAAGLRRWGRTPQRTFVRLTLALTAVSFVPSVLVDADLSTTVVLLTTHVVAAALVIPAVASRLRD